MLAAESAYAESGHLNGPRLLAPGTAAVYEFEGSNCMYANGASCSQCHTSQGFASFVNTGTAGDQEPASPPGCFTCHNPHETGDFSLRTTSAVTLIDTVSVFDKGKGNLCATCHHNISTPAAYTTGAGPIKWNSGQFSGPHHGVQADFILGKNNWASGNTYVATSLHATTDSCVSCHKFDPASGNFSGTLELGGHGFFLTGAVHGAQKDIVALCASCHTAMVKADTTFEQTHHSVDDWAWIKTGTATDPLIEIRALRDKLVNYFATTGVSATLPIIPVPPVTQATITALPVWPTTIEWNRDFAMNPATASLTTAQSQSFWNLKLFLEDRSNGIHNPTFAAEILWDAIVNLNTVVGGTGTPIDFGGLHGVARP